MERITMMNQIFNPGPALRGVGLSIAVFLMSMATVRAQTVLEIPSTTYGAGQPVVVTHSGEITNGTNGVTVSANATVIYHATSKVTLKPGFHASAGSKFYVQIGANLDTDGDGIPDVWERAHGLNPSNASDAQGTLPGTTVTYLAAYQMGLRSVGSTPQTDSTNATQLKVHRPNTQ